MKDEISMAFSISCILFASGILLLAAGYAWSWIWCWVDDKEKVGHNPVVAIIMRIYGYKKNDTGEIYNAYINKNGKTTDAILHVFLSIGVLYILPYLVWAYPLGISIVIVFIIAHIARFARRHKKLFDKHIIDKDAHK